MSQKIRGIRSPIPAGYLLGRKGTGTGDVGLVKISDLSSKFYVQQAIAAGVPVGANPTATAGNVAVNGSAATFMRSDGAPAISLASSSVYGIVKVDGTTILSTGGVLSATASGGGSMLPLVNGDLPGPAFIADDKGQCIGVPL